MNLSPLKDPDMTQVTAKLPQPFCPPSLSDDPAVPRALPTILDLPDVPQEKSVSSFDKQDTGTPDAWIPRDERLVRLTGKHPFNCEAKLKDLYAEGFLTPINLFYVRNHGAVPKFEGLAEDWKLKVHGLCLNPATFSIPDLLSMFEVVTIPVTLVCAGNRRKEQNIVAKSLGFSWGAGGVSTALFTGVFLSDVLDYVRPTKLATHVIFEGCDSLPQGPYGTSQRINWARDRHRGMLICWAMNGLPLEPDHGFPLRIVIPGQIGGRSVKWLTRIELSDIESQHYLHFNDNKVLPTSVDADQARKETQWWYDPRYIINDLNVNSVIACPDHNEVLDVSIPDDSYVLKGYAYAGGGRRVTRVEISLDDAASWKLADIEYPEDKYRVVTHQDPIYGNLGTGDTDTSFCWCFWSLAVTMAELRGSELIIVRCMDESLALQPRDMYWNATGMMNNWWFRVCIRKIDDHRVRFEHPTMAGTQAGGWMQRLKDEGYDPARPAFSTQAPIFKASPSESLACMIDPKVTRLISSEEIQAHSNSVQPWFVVDGQVYDATEFLGEHPGGSSSITVVAGEDATEDFLAIHSLDAKRQLSQFHIGTLSGQLKRKEDPILTQVTGTFLDRKRWRKVILSSVRDVSKDSKIFRFGLDKPVPLGLPIGQHVYARLRRKTGAKIEGELVQRAYTPISCQDETGWVDFLVKIYYPTAGTIGGKMSLGFAELGVGDAVELKGPFGDFIWKGNGTVLLHDKPRQVCELGMICGGSGITPIYQFVRALLLDRTDKTTKVSVIDSNRTLDDILCQAELDELAAHHSSRFILHYTLTGDDIPRTWPYSKGRIDRKMLTDHLPTPGKDKIIGICGPPSMQNNMKDLLKTMGWDEYQIVVF
ncbi:nitrate reductase [Mycena floridula]|nr:nitrate reductase [Mycena floridula]